MPEQIISREYVRSLGRLAFKAGHGRESHRMNWHAAAVVDWYAGWDEAKAEQAEKAAA